MSFLENYLVTVLFLFMILTICLLLLTIWAERDKEKYIAMLEDERELSNELRQRLAIEMNKRNTPYIPGFDAPIGNGLLSERVDKTLTERIKEIEGAQILGK